MKLKQQIILIALLILMSTLVIGNLRLSSFIYPLLWVGIPIFIYSLLLKKKSIVMIVLFVLIAIPYFLYTAAYILGFVFCGYSQMKYEYVNKKNSSIKIVGRDYSCYGTTEDLVLYKEYPILESIRIQIYYKTFVDYKNINIDTTIWKPVK
jgi:predicted membrane protein